jgi:integrase/recombinase XerD
MAALRQRMTEDMQLRNLALNTQLSYLQQVSCFARHFGKSPECGFRGKSPANPG